MDDLVLERSSQDLWEPFLDMAAEFAAYGEERYLSAARDRDAFFRDCERQASGRHLPPGRVAQSRFWLTAAGERILGESRLRHELTPELEYEGGHVGYDIRPSERGKGYGTRLLEMTLAHAAARGLRQVRITCDADNMASVRVIEKNGGRLDSEGASVRSGKTIRRYLVSTSR